ncbi:MAG: hypothetical protein CMG98_13790 [Marinovum sp.]|nr:hypothetical protein [Marinovum sp.]MAC37258.1 hypothetical protein [Halieaceae bacterium]
MDQPKPTMPREKPLVNRRWLLFTQYKWTGSGIQSVTHARGISIFYATFLKAICVQKCVQNGRFEPRRAAPQMRYDADKWLNSRV